MRSGSSIRPTFSRSPSLRQTAARLMVAPRSKSAARLVTRLLLLGVGQTWVAHVGHFWRALKTWVVSLRSFGFLTTQITSRRKIIAFKSGAS